MHRCRIYAMCNDDEANGSELRIKVGTQAFI